MQFISAATADQWSQLPQEDPEIMEVLNKAKSGGLGSMMQLMQDQSFMEKVGRKMGGGMGGGGGGNPLAAAAAAPPVAAAAPPAEALPDIENLLDAAKCAMSPEWLVAYKTVCPHGSQPLTWNA